MKKYIIIAVVIIVGYSGSVWADTVSTPLTTSQSTKVCRAHVQATLKTALMNARGARKTALDAAQQILKTSLDSAKNSSDRTLARQTYRKAHIALQEAWSNARSIALSNYKNSKKTCI